MKTNYELHLTLDEIVNDMKTNKLSKLVRLSDNTAIVGSPGVRDVTIPVGSLKKSTFEITEKMEKQNLFFIERFKGGMVEIITMGGGIKATFKAAPKQHPNFLLDF